MCTGAQGELPFSDTVPPPLLQDELSPSYVRELVSDTLKGGSELIACIHASALVVCHKIGMRAARVEIARLDMDSVSGDDSQRMAAFMELYNVLPSAVEVYPLRLGVNDMGVSRP